jgi:hypothetical protein
MTKSIIHPKEKRPVNKATMDQPQEEFVDDQSPPSREQPEPPPEDARTKPAPAANPLPSRVRE